MAKAIAEGDKAPNFNLPIDAGGNISLSDCAGHPLILYFYPKDDTSGCTKQAIEFSLALPKFKKLGVKVIGVSKDSLTSHEKFKSKHKLKISLGSDPEGKALESYGVWVEKSMYGRKYMGIERSTFLIDSKGRISRIWRKVKVPGHVEEVLAVSKAL
jgi:thioredoxin-dependent peroxiredoxin